MLQTRTIALLLAFCGTFLQRGECQVALRLDPAFSDDGIAVTDFGGDFESGGSLLRLPDGRYLQAGGTNRPFAQGLGGFDLAVAAYTADGVLDPSFGTGGILIVDLDGTNAYNEWIHAIALAPDGQIVVTGRAERLRSTEGDRVFAARFDAQGRLDPSFGTGGLVLLDLPGANEQGVDVFATAGGTVAIGIGGTGDLAAVRLLNDGTLDPSFGEGGLARADAGGNETARAFAVDVEGRLVAAGATWAADSAPADVTVARWLPNGQLDPAFGDGGMTAVDVEGRDDQAHFVTVGSEGDLTLFGFSGARPGGNYEQFAFIARLGPDGSPVSDPGGPAVRLLRDLGHAAVIDGVIPMAGGGHYAAVNQLTIHGSYRAYLARLLPDASFDASFGDDGFVSLSEPTGTFLMDEDGRVVGVAGTGWADFRLMRYRSAYTVSKEAPDAPRARALRLEAAYPNPASGLTRADLILDSPQPVRVSVYDLLGRRLRDVFASEVYESRIVLDVDLRGLPAGTYVLRARGARGTDARLLTVGE